jgi:hypothetical protein
LQGVVGEEMNTTKLGVVGGGGSVKIFPNAMEVVQNLKKILENNDDEIYVTLKECNMDLNETAQQLLNQGVIAFICFFQQSFL